MTGDPGAWAVAAPSPWLDAQRLQRRRRLTQAAFFALFVLAPSLNLLRFDLYETQLWFLGFRWSLGIDAFLRGEAGAAATAVSILVRGFLPVIALAALVLGVAYRYGRLYCGWLCPHFSMVETLNDLLHRASGKFSVWERSGSPREGRDPRARWWPVFLASCLVLGFVWAITLLTYLLPPRVIWGNLVTGALTPNQARFLGVATLVFTLEFVLARHLFCRFGCAVGLFQSLAWMANPRALVVAFARARTPECRSCDAPRGNACDRSCPMRLNPRTIKRLMFSCVQCGRCLDACEKVQGDRGRTPLLTWTVGVDALRETARRGRNGTGR